MHIITNCPRCGKDFMYHSMDTHLFIEVKISDKKDKHTDTIAICQDCDEIENSALNKHAVSERSEQCLHTERVWTIDPYDQKCFKCVKCGEYGV